MASVMVPECFGGASLWPEALSAAPAAAAALLAAGTVITLVAVRRGLPVVAAAGTALAPGSRAMVGHTRVYGPGWLVLAADLLHVATAALWVGDHPYRERNVHLGDRDQHHQLVTWPPRGHGDHWDEH
ncbi:hypothetical protein [Nonomuraea mesophila]|uniref:hypothetical protein n=1 Tax=Nonomuraea mesophila TaxID=2530382 RepID=UPI001FE54D73|nr:hypothetical protein [Nonomuraea mesophila]